MATYYPISFTAPQYEDTSGNPYSGAVLKAYAAGTSTPINMATDYTGGTLVSTITLNASGFPAVSGNVIIPHVGQNFKLALYPTSAAATLNTGAIWTIDNIQIAQNANAARYINFADDTGSADSYVVAPDPAISAYVAGQVITLSPAHTNTGASTLVVSGLATKDIKMKDGAALVAGNLLSTGEYQLVYNGTYWVLTNESVLTFPVGSIVDYAGLTAPTGWLLCFGQAISRTTYAALFAVISTTYGVGDGSTTFNLPDLRGRVIAGQDDMGGSSANRLTGLSGGVDGDVLGAVGGEEAHTISSSQMPSHTHLLLADVEATTDYPTNAQQVGKATSGGLSNFDVQIKSGTATAATLGLSSATGGSTAMNVVQPVIILNKIIKT